MCAPIALYLKWRAELRHAEQRAADDTASQMARLSERLTGLGLRLEDLEASRTRHQEWVAQTEGLSLNRRGQVLRLHRRGESVAGIASALQLGRAEVQLMIKVHEFAKAAAAED